MDVLSIFATLAFALSAAAYVPYIASILRSNKQPTLSTWVSWGLMDVAILAGMVTAGEIAWQMVAYVIGVSLVIGASLYKCATIGWTHLDSGCLTIVTVAIGLWVVTGDPNIAIILSLVAVTVGTVPMVVNIWKDPVREAIFPWLLFLAGGIFGVLAIPTWNIAAALTPVWFLVLQVAIVLLIARKWLHSKAIA